MEPSENDITTTRNMALDKLEKPPGSKHLLSSISTTLDHYCFLGLMHQVHPKDVDRLKSDNSWIRRFLLHHDLDKDKAVNMILGTLQWRFKTGVNGIVKT